jgi:TRAP-type C4-dicarboxylate transport system substrate-binding protein
MSLKTGVVDGCELPTGIITQQKMYGLVKYISLTGIHSIPFFMHMNLKTFKSLPPSDQKILIDSGMEAAKLNRKLTKEQDEEAARVLPIKHGIRINKVDKSLFRKITDSVYKKYEKRFGKELISAIVETK